MLFLSQSPQRGTRTLDLIVVPGNLSGSLAQSATGVTEGTFQVTASTSGTGQATVKFNKPFARKPVIAILPMHASTNLCAVLTAVSATQFSFQINSDAGVATAPTEVHIQIRGFDVAQQI